MAKQTTERSMVGFRLPAPKRFQLERWLIARRQKGKPLGNKQDLFEWLVERVLAGETEVPDEDEAEAEAKAAGGQ